MWTVVASTQPKQRSIRWIERLQRRKARKSVSLCCVHWTLFFSFPFFCFLFHSYATGPAIPLSPFAQLYTSCLTSANAHAHTPNEIKKNARFGKYSPFAWHTTPANMSIAFECTACHRPALTQPANTLCVFQMAFVSIEKLTGIVCVRLYVWCAFDGSSGIQRNTRSQSASVFKRSKFSSKTWSVFSADTFCVILPNNLFNLIFKRQQQKTKKTIP